MVNILVFGMTANPGGMESCVMNYYRHINKEEVHFDFLVNISEKMAFEDEVSQAGSKVFRIAAKRENYSLYKKQMKDFFENNADKYDAIWINSLLLSNIDYLIYAKKYGIKKRIIHSHNSKNVGTTVNAITHWINKQRVGKYATDFWMCSLDAGKWFYNESELAKAVYIYNAINVKDMLYDESKDLEIRRKYNLEGKYVIGNVGRLDFQKNQMFAIDVISKLVAKMDNAMMVFVGQGDDEMILKDKVKTLGLSDKILFTGVQSDISAWLSSFDFFLFPSIFEGLGIAALEAQANGLPVLASMDVIPQDAKVNDNFTFFELEKSADEWADKIIEMSGMARENQDVILQNFQNCGFDIEYACKNLEKIFVS